MINNRDSAIFSVLFPSLPRALRRHLSVSNTGRSEIAGNQKSKYNTEFKAWTARTRTIIKTKIDERRRSRSEELNGSLCELALIFDCKVNCKRYALALSVYKLLKTLSCCVCRRSPRSLAVRGELVMGISLFVSIYIDIFSFREEKLLISYIWVQIFVVIKRNPFRIESYRERIDMSIGIRLLLGSFPASGT